eukprot:NODE_238_length_13323_cov_0.463854.p4 type:complete len:375 gc:universal NODE_238_length_13323_cov_0.463854:2923-1799(-)
MNCKSFFKFLEMLQDVLAIKLNYMYCVALQTLFKPVLGSVISSPTFFLAQYLNLYPLYQFFQPWVFWISMTLIGYNTMVKQANPGFHIVLYAMTTSAVRYASFYSLKYSHPLFLAGLQLALMYCALNFRIANQQSRLTYAITALFLLLFPNLPIYVNPQYIFYFLAIVLIVKYKRFFLLSVLVLDISLVHNLEKLCKNELISQNYNILFSSWNKNEFIQVIHNNKNNLRFQRHHHSVIGAMYMSFHDSAFEEFYIPDAVILSRRDVTGCQALIIGLGVGISAGSMTEYGLNVEVAELDPLVGYTAKKWFDLPSSVNLTIEDGLDYLRNAKTYDFIIHDVFSDGNIPGKLFTVECLRQVKEHLSSDGILAIVNYY